MKQEQDGLSSLGDRIKQKTPPFFKKLRTIGLVVAAIGTSLVMAPVALPVLVTTIGGYLLQHFICRFKQKYELMANKMELNDAKLWD